MPNWDIESTYSAVSSIPSLRTKNNKFDEKLSMNTATFFSSISIPLSTLHPTSNIENLDDDVSILICIEQEYDFQAINEKYYIIKSPNIQLDENLGTKNISQIYNQIKHASACTPELLLLQTNVNNDVFFDSNQYEQHEELFDYMKKSINQYDFHLFIDYQFIANIVKGSQHNIQYLRTYQVDKMITALDWLQLIDEQESFNTLAFGVTTAQKYHKLELLQPMLL